MPKAVVIGVCVVVILVMIGVIFNRERRRRAAAIMDGVTNESRPPAELICKYGNFRFKWPYGQSTIDFYLILEMGLPDRLMGHLETVTPEGEMIDYDWDPFAIWCKRFVAEMARAKLPGNSCRDCGNRVGESHTVECPRSGTGPNEFPPKSPSIVKVIDTEYEPPIEEKGASI